MGGLLSSSILIPRSDSGLCWERQRNWSVSRAGTAWLVPPNPFAPWSKIAHCGSGLLMRTTWIKKRNVGSQTGWANRASCLPVLWIRIVIVQGKMCSKKPLLLNIEGIFSKIESAMNYNNKWLWVSLESPFSMGMKCWGVVRIQVACNLYLTDVTSFYVADWICHFWSHPFCQMRYGPWSYTCAGLCSMGK